MPWRPSTSTRRVRRAPAAGGGGGGAAACGEGEGEGGGDRGLPGAALAGYHVQPGRPTVTCGHLPSVSGYTCLTSQTNHPVLLITVRFSFWLAFCTLAVVSVRVVDSTARS